MNDKLYDEYKKIRSERLTLSLMESQYRNWGNRFGLRKKLEKQRLKVEAMEKEYKDLKKALDNL